MAATTTTTMATAACWWCPSASTGRFGGLRDQYESAILPDCHTIISGLAVFVEKSVLGLVWSCVSTVDMFRFIEPQQLHCLGIR
jgi:hypothetical protein